MNNAQTSDSPATVPSSNHDKNVAASPMFELTNVQGRITLDNVYLNGLHALRRIELRNLSDQFILVKMRSNLRNQIAFQLENENIRSIPETFEIDTSTNTVNWSREAEKYPFNQLFNLINHVDEIELAPGQCRSLVLTFLPERPDSTDEEDDFGEHTVPDDMTETYNMFNVTGSLFFFGYYSATATTIEEGARDVLATSSLADYQVSVKFRASVCQSALWTDAVETGLNFEDCVLGETYYKDFSIQNKSEIDLYWLLNTIDLSKSDWLQFVDAETEEPLNNDPIPSYQSKQVRILFMPKEVGEFNYDLQLENVNDSRNVIQIKMHATVRSVLRKETLMISSGNVIDFGDCVSGSWAIQQIVLNNVSESPVEIRFIPEGAEVIFDIKQDATERDAVVEPSSRISSIRRKFSNNGGSRTAGFNTPVTTHTTFSELSAPNSELSSRSTSPTLLRAHNSEHIGAGSETYSPLPVADSPSNSRIQFPSQPPTIPEDSDSDIGLGLMSVDGGMLTETSSVTDSVTNMSSSITGTNNTNPANAAVTLTNIASVPLSTTESYTRIEDLLLKPGTERTIQVSYRPQKDASINDFNAGQLIRKNFRILLEYGTFRTEEPKEKKVIQCKARTCTSFVEAIPKIINFGDTDVGTLKSLPINIFNRSDILARVELQFSSKVLNCLRGEITIQPRSYVELKLDLYPRKVNPDYRKQITLVNFLNKDNDQIIEVHSTNIDKNRVTFHSLFYRILTATGANFLDFGSIALNSPSLRTFTVENIRDKPLSLEITTSLPEDIAIYTRNKNRSKESGSANVSSTNNASTVASIASTAPLGSTAVSTLASSATLAAASINTTSSSKLSKSITAESVKKGDALADASASPTNSNRKRSKLLLESISNRRMNKLVTEAGSTDLEAINNRHSSETKNGLMMARHFRHSIQQLKMNQTHSSTAYLDLALPPLHSLKFYRQKMIQIRSDMNFLNKQGRSEDGNFQEDKSERQVSKKSMLLNSPLSLLTNRLENQNRQNNYGTRNAKTKRSLGITAARYKFRKNLDWSDIAGKSRVPFEDLISVLEHGSKTSPPLFPKQSAEEQFVRYQLAWRRELDRLVEKGVLVRTSIVDVDPRGEEEVIVVITPCGATKPHIQSAPKKQDARIFLRLVEFDRNIEQTEFENLLDLNQTDIPVREVIVRSQLCRSVMDLGQKNINFGLVERNERHAKTIVLHNRSETPLLYAIRKSGSIASGDINLDVGRYGVVRSYGKREVEFVFEPTLSGPFMEKLIIENIRDRTNDQVLLLKAQVRKPSTFLIKSLEMSFGLCLVDQPCRRTETIVLTNTNKQSRMFEVRVDPNEVSFGRYYAEFEFDVKEDDTNTISKEAEEEIENLEQKLKIAKRKAQPDKIKKYLRKLAKLKNIDEDKIEASYDPDDGSAKKDVADLKQTEKEDVKDIETMSTHTANTSLTTNTVVFKKTAESVVFPLDAHASKTISVTFKPVLRPFQPEKMEDETITHEPISVKGRILVHEYKNTDVCKSIAYTAEVYADSTAYARALSAEKEVSPDTADDARIDQFSSVTNTTAHASNVDTTSLHTLPSQNIIDVSSSPSEDPKVLEEESTEALQLERNFFDGGRIELNQNAVFYVKITNESTEAIDFDFVVTEQPSVFDFSSSEDIKELLPGETKKIRYGLVPNRVGRQLHSFSIRNNHTGTLQPFTIQCLVHCGQYLSFPSLADEANGVLDLGFSYVDPGSKYSQVTPLLVENTSSQDVFLTCQSNLSHQVLIFMDEAGERGLVEMMPLKRGGMATVWVAVQPNLLTGYLGSSVDECRELVGGIKFSIFEKPSEDDDMLLMLTQTVKFTSIIGQSHLTVSDRIINLGYTDLLQKEFYGAFTIRNESGELPLDYEVECATGNIQLDRRGGTLNGWKGIKTRRDADLEYLNPEGNDSIADLSTPSTDTDMRRGSYDDPASVAAASSLTQITFRINAYRYGLLNEKLIVTNKRNSQEVFIIDVRLFVDCKKLDAWSLPSKTMLRGPQSANQHGYIGDDQTDHLEADPLPTIKWESLYICPVSHESEQETALQLMELSEQDTTRLCVREMDIANTSGQPMQLIAMSDIDITASFMVDEDKVKVVELEQAEGFLVQRSDQLALQPGQRIRIRLHSPSAEKLDEEGRSLALQGKSGSLKGMMVLFDARQNLEVFALELEALFCVSHTELSTRHIDLGKIGHSTSYKPARFEFHISNLADIPASYEICGPKFIQFTPLDRNGVAIKQKMFYIPSRKTQRVEGLLLPNEMPDQTSGIHRFDVRINNLRNNTNTMHLHLKCLMTVFELRFGRLSSNGEVVLPTLHHPIALQNALCDNWFVVHNKTDDDLRFEIGADITPELEPYVHLDVLSRYTNSPLNGDIAIGPQGSIEVRVRASPNEMSRLPRNRPELTDPLGVIIAKLWVTTCSVEEDEESRAKAREVIPVRCVLEETSTFSLSERRLDFKLVTYYQDGASETSLNNADCMPESCSLSIVNHASKASLRIKATVEGPAEFPAHEIVMISGLDPESQQGTIAPASTLTLSIAISNSKESMPGQLKLHIDDLDALGESRQTVIIYLTEIVWDL
ncbi:hypothetical protein EDC96DRAFT_479026 [Choanephora cucurbitarum]|nr:hypothetical protein EDC96DRAFT_479026 [Choanephora cucurbitarum]